MLYSPNFDPEYDPADGLISRASMARYILKLMAEDYSQNHHLISWTQEMPYVLWDNVHGRIRESALGTSQLNEAERKLFLDLALTADGWWLDIHKSKSFVSLREWKEMFEQRTAT